MVNPALAKASTTVSGGRDLREIKAQTEGLVELEQSLVLISTADGGKVGQFSGLYPIPQNGVDFSQCQASCPRVLKTPPACVISLPSIFSQGLPHI